MQKATPRHPQTGHTWHKFALSGLFITINLRFYMAHKKGSEAKFVQLTKMNESSGTRVPEGFVMQHIKPQAQAILIPQQKPLVE